MCTAVDYSSRYLLVLFYLVFIYDIPSYARGYRYFSAVLTLWLLSSSVYLETFSNIIGDEEYMDMKKTEATVAEQ